jgi:hypothetical protein
MKRIASIIFFGLVLVGLVGCTDHSRTSFLELTGRVFIFNPRLATATYVVTFNILKEPPAASKIIVVFENPAGGADLIVEQKLKLGQAKVSFESEPLQCVRADRRYKFVATLSTHDGIELQKVESSILSTLDQSVLPEAPLVDGPGYDANPALNDSEGIKILRERVLKCPA